MSYDMNRTPASQSPDAARPSAKPLRRRGPLPLPSSPAPMDTERSDSDLVAACREGNERAWEQLVLRYQGLVYSTAVEAGLTHDDSADVFQHVWTEFYRSLPRFRHAITLPRWLVVATRRHSYKVAARRRRVVRETYHEMVDPKALPDEKVEALESRRRLEVAMEKLDASCDKLLRMLFFSSQKVRYAEVARRTKIAIGSIGPTRARCLQKLRVELGGAE